MSKSLDNYIGLDDSPKEMYGKTLSIPDSQIYNYFLLATDTSPSDLADVKKKLDTKSANPRDIKRTLARQLVAMYHSNEEAASAEEEFDKIFIKKDVPDVVDEFVYPAANGPVGILQLLVDTKLAGSKGEARRLVEQGGVSVDGEKITDIGATVELGQPALLKVGRRRFLKVVPRKE
jgi:tyrosyl-tRNA synthetase